MLKSTFLRCARQQPVSPLPSRLTTPTLSLQQHRLSSSTNNGSKEKQQKIALLGSGTIGLSFAALHLTANPTCTVTIHDTRPDLYDYISAHLPSYILPGTPCSATYKDRLTLAPSLAKAVEYADIVQEQGPENVSFKAKLWAEVEKHARSDALLWSSTSGIPASEQGVGMKDKKRLMVVHPYNPPHIMPLLEIVPSKETSQKNINRTVHYWRSLGRTPVVIKKECTGFVANRLAFALFREACSLVAQDVVSVKELDDIVTSSMGPRWSVAGPFKSYQAGGGEEGLEGFLSKIGGTVQGCWDASERDVKKGDISVGDGKEWQEKVCKQAQEEYRNVDTSERDARTREVLQAAAAEKGEGK
ncbi:hypothetical protein LTR37_012855 [Vermiconidia calcicola]|uniref:Uncharacterized protein n=1 Tax=Vermiconidia calcicola TaxID=1690605 RepID=A0ACC3MXV8_9PEZI|nr:hypothetical protein LTR37_012855 [Vermiconidia calcicola]